MTDRIHSEDVSSSAPDGTEASRGQICSPLVKHGPLSSRDIAEWQLLWSCGWIMEH